MESEKELRELIEPRELMEPGYLMDGVVDVHVEYEVAYLEVYPTQVKGQRWYHLWVGVLMGRDRTGITNLQSRLTVRRFFF